MATEATGLRFITAETAARTAAVQQSQEAGVRSEMEAFTHPTPAHLLHHQGQRATLNLCLAILRTKDFHLAGAVHATQTLFPLT